MRPTERGHRGRSLLLVLSLLVLATPVAAQDFSFGRPWFTFGVYGGWDMPGESSDVFDFTREQLTVGEGDFAAPLLGLEGAVRLTERIDLAVGVERAEQSVSSEMRDWVTQNDQPIPQSTEFTRTRLMGSAKFYLLERGRQISRYAWVPNDWAPFVGGGAGIGWFDYLQEGDFVDEETLDIFEDRFESSGSAPIYHVMAGVDVSLSNHFLLRGEYRYIWGEADMGSGDFIGFDDLDLSSSRLTLGLAIR